MKNFILRGTKKRLVHFSNERQWNKFLFFKEQEKEQIPFFKKITRNGTNFFL
jgi:hypothetical protein